MWGIQGVWSQSRVFCCSYGRTGRRATELALSNEGLSLLSMGMYNRSLLDVRTGLVSLKEAGMEPQVIVMIGESFR